MNQPYRIEFASIVGNECSKNPELITNLICIIADELSNSDLYRIQQLFMKSKENVYNKKNILN